MIKFKYWCLHIPSYKKFEREAEFFNLNDFNASLAKWNRQKNWKYWSD